MKVKGSCIILVLSLGLTAAATQAQMCTPSGIAFTYNPYQGRPFQHIAVTDPQGKNEKPLTTVTDTYDTISPSWRPDGMMFAFTSSEITGSSYPQVWVADCDGGNARRMTPNQFDKADNDAPTWSPDGTRIAFTSSGQIYVMAANGSNPIQITHITTEARNTRWSPNGDMIVFTEVLGKIRHISLVDVKTSHVTPLNPSTLIDDFPAWSPDGKTIIFVRTNPSVKRKSTILTMNASGKLIVPYNNYLTTNDTYQFPSYSCDGKAIFFSGAAGIYTMNQNDKLPRVLINIISSSNPVQRCASPTR